MRVVRNFWINARIDGRNTNLSGGPRSKGGAFEQTIYQRSDGSVTVAAQIDAYAMTDGTLVLRITDGQGNLIHEHRTNR